MTPREVICAAYKQAAINKACDTTKLPITTSYTPTEKVIKFCGGCSGIADEQRIALRNALQTLFNHPKKIIFQYHIIVVLSR